MSNENLSIMTKKRKFPIGSSSFAELVKRENGEYRHYFVDKTLFIQQSLETDSKVLLFPRFRRCGKSMNLDMLHCFYDVNEKEDNQKLFQGLKIEKAFSANQQPCMQYQGQHPVIFPDFKKLSQSNFKDMYEQFKILLYEIYYHHSYLLKSEKLSSSQKEIIRSILSRKADDAIYKNALKFLMQFLSQHHDNKKV